MFGVGTGSVLRGQQARDFLESNPGYSYEVINQNTGQAVGAQGMPNMGALDQIAAALISPFTDTVTGTAEQMNFYAQPEQQRENYQARYMTNEDFGDYVENPFLRNAQNAAGVGAYLVPGVGGAGGFTVGTLGKAAAGGALGGALGGLYTSDTDQLMEGDLSNILSGAGIGGIAGGGLYAASKAAPVGFRALQNRFSSTGDDIAANVGGQKNRITQAIAGQSDDQLDDVTKVLMGQTDDQLDDLTRLNPNQTKTLGGNRVSKALREFSDDQQLSAFRRRMGSPAPKGQTGGAVLERKFKSLADRMGAQINEPSDALAFTDDIYKQYGSVADDYARQLSEKGVTINIDDVLEPLQKQLDDTLLPRLKKPVQNAIDDIKLATGNTGQIDPVTAMRLRRQIGKVGKWSKSPLSQPDVKTLAASYEKAYTNFNDVLDDAFKQNGLGQFREANRMLSTARDAEMWAKNSLLRDRPNVIVNDMMQDLGLGAGFATGNPLFSVGGAMGGRYLQSPAFQNQLGKAVGKLADVADVFGGGRSAVVSSDDVLNVLTRAGSLGDDAAANTMLTNAFNISADDASKVLNELNTGAGQSTLDDAFTRAVSVGDDATAAASNRMPGFAAIPDNTGGQPMQALGIARNNARQSNVALENILRQSGGNPSTAQLQELADSLPALAAQGDDNVRSVSNMIKLYDKSGDVSLPNLDDILAGRAGNAPAFAGQADNSMRLGTELDSGYYIPAGFNGDPNNPMSAAAAAMYPENIVRGAAKGVGAGGDLAMRTLTNANPIPAAATYLLNDQDMNLLDLARQQGAQINENAMPGQGGNVLGMSSGMSSGQPSRQGMEVIRQQEGIGSGGSGGRVLGMSSDGSGAPGGQVAQLMFGGMQQPQQAQQPAFDKQGFAMALLGSGASPSAVARELEALDQIFGGGATGNPAAATFASMSPSQQSEVRDLQGSLNTLDKFEGLINQTPEYFNPTDIGGRIQDVFGGVTIDPRRQEVKNNLESYAVQLLRQFSGAAASDREYERIRELVPTVYDKPDVARSKLQVLRDFAKNNLETKLSDPTQQMGVASYF